jgi:signal transduction histidine kinase
VPVAAGVAEKMTAFQRGPGGDRRGPPIDRRGSTRLLREFSRVFTAALDLPRTLETFADAVIEYVRPTRLALLVPDPESGAYRVRVHRRLAPPIVSSVRLSADSGLCRWLIREGRPFRLADPAEPAVARELRLLQGHMAVPLLAGGELVAVLVLGGPVIAPAYGDHEVETIFDLASHLAATIRGIALHRRVQQANELSERILEEMSSGVVTVGADERVSRLNRRAAELLDLPAHDVVGQHLRELPSPLGNMLAETLVTGRARPLEEIRLEAGRLWLGVSTYPIRDDEAMGAVLVFDDLTTRKKLAARKRETEHYELVVKVVARITEEIKNPLASISAFMELVDERLADPPFRRQFTAAASRDVGWLVHVVEKLTGLVTDGELDPTTVDVHAFLEETAAAMRHGDAWRAPIDVHLSREATPILLRVDAGQLRKALAYLVWYLAHHSPEGAPVSLSVKRDGGETVRIIVASRAASVPARQIDHLFDPVRMAQESLIDIGPAVSQRLVAALGGRLQLRHGGQDLSFVVWF